MSRVLMARVVVMTARNAKGMDNEIKAKGPRKCSQRDIAALAPWMLQSVCGEYIAN